MTMLDRMRRHNAWLKWSLAIVVLAFILLYIPQFLPQTGVGAAPSDVIATVNGREVPAGKFQQVYNQQVMQLRSAYGEVSDDMLRQLGVSQRIIQQLVNQEAELAEAERLGLRVTDGELRQRLTRMPEFQENGQFIGESRYTQMLNMARPPIRPSEFEADVRRALLAEKLQAAVSGWIRVSDADVETEYRRRNEKIKAELAIFRASQFAGAVQPTDADLTAHFSANRETYRVPEKRRVRYLAVDAASQRAKVTVTPAEIEARYRENLATYQTPEQVRASHILLKTEGKDEAAVRKVAESVLAKAKGGADFAALAKQYSEDEASQVNGGDLDYFGRGAMVKEFDDAVWALGPGQISDLVKSAFGFHIIKLTDKRPAVTRSLEQVRSQLEDQIRNEKAQAEATRVAGEIAGEIDDPSDLDRVAAARGLTARDSGLFSRDEPLAGGLGFAPAVASEAFSLEAGKVSGQLQTPQGYAFIAVEEVKPAYVPELTEVRAKVTEDVRLAKAKDLARARAETMAAAARSGSFAAAARSAGTTVHTTDLVARGSTYPEIGVNEAVDAAVFALATGRTSGPIVTDDAIVVARVTERQDIQPTLLDAERETVRQQVLTERRGQFYEAYMRKAREKMTIEFNQNTITALLGQN